MLALQILKQPICGKQPAIVCINSYDNKFKQQPIIYSQFYLSVHLIWFLLTPFSFIVLVSVLYLIWVFFCKKMPTFWNALVTHFCCKLYKKAALQSLALLLIRQILYYTDHLLKSGNSLSLKSQQYKKQKASLLSMQISGFLLYKALIVLKRLCWFCLLAYVVNIRGIQWVGPSPLNLKINRSEILAKHLLLLQVSMQ